MKANKWLAAVTVFVLCFTLLLSAQQAEKKEKDKDLKGSFCFHLKGLEDLKYLGLHLEGLKALEHLSVQMEELKHLEEALSVQLKELESLKCLEALSSLEVMDALEDFDFDFCFDWEDIILELDGLDFDFDFDFDWECGTPLKYKKQEKETRKK